ncbi:uncharacterized protein [Lolium perenne]|uniref:uncharacterized protein n=1 Tax=Lolium perenne TaxID=4522 RepID=UPI0021EA3E3A|nr:uncharacterized protein LOC127304590 [Lolium perenne]
MPPLAAGAATSSRCGPFACRRGAHHQRAQAVAPAAADSGQGCGRPLVGRAAGLVGGGIAAAFFASLERCACVEVRTTDDLADWEAEPLMPRDDNGAAARNVNTARKSKRTAARAGAGKGRRGGGAGFGCCENSN